MSDRVNSNNGRLPLPAEKPEAERSDTSPESASPPASPPSISPSPNTLLANRNRLRLLAQPGPSATGGADPALAAAAPGHHPSPPVAALAYHLSVTLGAQLLPSATTSPEAIEHLAATKLNMRAVPVEPDGNCLFRALAVSIGMDQDDHPIVRHRAVEAAAEFYDLAQLQASGSDQAKPFETVNDYYAQMLRPTKGNETGWGGHTEMAAFANLQRIRLVVHDLVGGIPAQQFGPENGPPHHIGRLTPDHFVALFPRQHHPAPPSDQAAVPASEAAPPASEAAPLASEAAPSPPAPKQPSTLDEDVLVSAIKILEKEQDVRSLQSLRRVNRNLRDVVSSIPGDAQRQAIFKTIGNLKDQFAKAWEIPKFGVPPISFQDSEHRIGTTMQSLLERSAFLPADGIDTLLGSHIHDLFESNQLPNRLAEAWNDRRLRQFTARFANARPLDRQTLSPSMDAFIARISENPADPDDPFSLWRMMGAILQDTSCLTDTQSALSTDKFFQLSTPAKSDILNRHLFDMAKLEDTDVERLVDFYGETMTQPNSFFMPGIALASIATHPVATERTSMHQYLFNRTTVSSNPILQNGIFYLVVQVAFDFATKASARSVRQLWDHLTARFPPVNPPPDHDPLRLLRSGTKLGRLLIAGMTSNRSGMAPTFADLVTTARLPPDQIARVFNGGELSDTPLVQTPLMAAIGTGSLNQMNEWKQAVLSLDLPRDTRQRLLAQPARGGDPDGAPTTALAYLRAQQADYITIPALAAYRDIERDFGLDPAP